MADDPEKNWESPDTFITDGECNWFVGIERASPKPIRIWLYEDDEYFEMTADEAESLARVLNRLARQYRTHD